MTAETSLRSSGATVSSLVRRDGLALDHRGDDEDVVGRQVLGPGAAKVDPAPDPLERGQLLRDQLRRSCFPRELVERREEEALDAAALQVQPERSGCACAGGGGLVGDAGKPRSNVSLADRDLPDLGHPIGHLPNAEALGEDDPQGRGSSRRTRVERGERENNRCQHDGETPSHRL